MNIKVSDLVAEFLEKLEIKVVFGIIGSANSHIFDSISKRGYTQIVCVHHEQAAVMSAGAYFRTSGKLSAALVTAGAGSSNAVTGVVSNWADSIPCIIISGQEQTYHIKNHANLRMYGIQGFDSPKMVEKVTKYAKTIMEEKTVQDELEKAYKTTLSSRPGPVWLDFPFDIQAKTIESREWNLELPRAEFQFDAAPNLIFTDIQYVIDCLKKCERPVIWGGHGVRLSGAKEEFREMVSTLKIPTILTWSAIDLLSEDNDYYFGRAGVNGQRRSNFIIQNSDLILVLGSRLSLLQAGYDINNLAPKAKIIMVDIDTNEWHKYHQKYDRFIQMDCKYFIKELMSVSQNTVVAPVSYIKHEWLNYCFKIREEYPLKEPIHIDSSEEYLNSYNFIDEMCKYMHDDQIIVTDMGTALLSGHYSIKLTKNQTMFTSLGLGEMGYGLPGAIGAAFAAPDREVLCLNCDGGMMMNLQELQTIIHHKLPIKIVIFENDGYLMIKHTQKLLFNGTYNSVNWETGVSTPDYCELGEAFGFNTYGIRGYGKYIIPETLRNFFADERPSILTVKMDPEQDFLPKVKGVPQDDGNIVPASLEEMSPLLPYNKIESAMKWGLSEKSKQIKR
jgi:acetolactate synthase I/II/III large subunit